MKINVTQKHIDEGTQKNMENCAIARSIKEQGPRMVQVGDWGAYVDHQRYDIGKEGKEFVQKYDTDKSLVQPTELTLSPFFPRMQDVQAYQYHQYVEMKKAMSHNPMVAAEATYNPNTMSYTIKKIPFTAYQSAFNY